MRVRGLNIVITILAPLLVVAAYFFIYQQLFLSANPYVHHALLCASVFVLCAYYASRFSVSPVIKICIVFAGFGMILGLLEVFLLLFFPGTDLQDICASIF